ncbi:MAG TPA: nicotinate-nucleotide adenylyltransferase [Ignavibacteriales bacterium]|nr:nicotinate-nucleotide adenylyltransferase [Ignavibacteriales bacterium]
MKVGVFGGTFDPIHNGHLITAQAVKEIRGLDKIIFIPCYISPHKIDMFTASDGHRLNMINLAIKDIPYFEASPIEIDNQEISYTVDTLRELKKNYEELELIIGYDNILKFDTWKSPDEIMNLAKLIVLKRKVDASLSRAMNKYFGMAEFVDTPVIEISATEIRRRVKRNLPINFLVPPQVASYIQENKLYC